MAKTRRSRAIEEAEVQALSRGEITSPVEAQHA